MLCYLFLFILFHFYTLIKLDSIIFHLHLICMVYMYIKKKRKDFFVVVFRFEENKIPMEFIINQEHHIHVTFRLVTIYIWYVFKYSNGPLKYLFHLIGNIDISWIFNFLKAVPFCIFNIFWRLYNSSYNNNVND